MKKINHTAVARQIIQFVYKEKYYRNLDASREEVAEKVGVCLTVFSHIVEEKFGMSFPDLLNKYRSAYARKLLRSKSHADNTLEEIALMAGFKSRMTLHRAFLQFYGITPGTFRKSQNIASPK